MRVSPSTVSSIVVVGSLNRDLVVTAPRLPLPGETIHGTGYTQHNGGKGANQAIALARLEQSVSMVGCVGDDEDGTALVNALSADGIDVSAISRSSSRTGVAVITVDQQGENSIVVVAGANGDLDTASIDGARMQISSAEIVLAQLEVPILSVKLAFEHATGTVVLNPAPASPLGPEILGTVDYLIPNRTELAALAGSDVPEGDSQILDLVARLEFDGTVIVTLGSEGALAVGDGAIVARAVPPNVTVVDTVGAGDAFCAGFCDALARELSLADAVEWATACGTLATTTAGAQPSLPTADSVATLVGARS